MNSNKGNVQLLILCLIIIGLLVIMISIALLNQKTSNIKIYPLTSSKQEAKTKNRNSYDFTKILNENFLTYKNDTLGFSLNYPREVTVREYGTEAKEYFQPLKNTNIIGATNFSLVSQLAEGTELFDGVHVTLIYIENLNKIPLEQFVPQESKNTYPGEGDVVSREVVDINGINSLKTFTCCWGGGKTSYYLALRDNQYILEVDLFSAGPEKEKFNQVANKIIYSIKLDY